MRNHPFRYWLAENEARWRQDPFALLEMPELFGTPTPAGQGGERQKRRRKIDRKRRAR